VRRMLKGLLLMLAATLLVLGICHGLYPREMAQKSMSTGSAAQGLMLLDKDSSVYVLAVTDQSAAFAAGVQPGDFILRADGMDVSSAMQLDAFFDGKREALELLVRRSEGERLLTIRFR